MPHTRFTPEHQVIHSDDEGRTSSSHPEQMPAGGCFLQDGGEASSACGVETSPPLEPPKPLAYVDGVDSIADAPLSIRILAAIAVGTVLVLAQAVVLPLIISLLLALTLRPVVRRLRRQGVPLTCGALLTLGSLVMLSFAGVSSLIEPAQHWVDSAPAHMQRLESKLKNAQQQWRGMLTTSAKMQELAQSMVGEPAVAVEMHESRLMLPLNIATSTGTIVGNCLVVLVLAFFVLTAGDDLLNNVLANFPRLSEKKRTVQLVKDVERGITTYLSTVTLINVGLGVATAVGLWGLGFPNPALWGVMAFLFNYVPFFGPMVCTAVLCLVSLLSFDSFAYACVPPAYFVAISAVEGNVLTPMIVGRSMAINPILVFVALIAGGWAWGLAGAILAVPLLAVGKIAADKFVSTQWISRLLAG